MKASKAVVAEIKAKIAEHQEAIGGLERALELMDAPITLAGGSKAKGTTAAKGKKKRVVSAETRNKMSIARKAAWDKKKGIDTEYNAKTGVKKTAKRKKSNQ